jgi:crossover junction endodeoxyribonuclease RusA
MRSESEREPMKLQLPYPPSSNRYWRNWRGRMVISTAARAYKRNVKLIHIKQKPFESDVRVLVSVYRPRRMGDLDNSLKVLLDALKGIAFVDDKQVASLHAFRFDDKKRPRVEVLVEAMVPGRERPVDHG